MALSREQRSVVSRALGVARRLGASPREAKALIEALGVESNYRDLPYGDRDSVGALQQRPSQGWGSASESLETDVAQFLRAARKANRGRGSAGQLAQAVQRSAFPGRYDERSAEANALLKGSDLGGGGNVSGSVRLPTAGSVETSFPEPNVAPLAQLLSQQLEQQQRQTPETTPLPLPAMAAGPPTPNVPLPQGARIIQSAQPAVQQPQVSPLDLLPRTDAQLPEVSVTSGRPGSVSASSGPDPGRAGLKGKVGGPLLESFYNGPGGVNVKNGRRVKRGFVSGHTDHVHVAGGPKTVVSLGRLAEEMGLTVRENPAFDPVDPVHVKGSYHYRKQAIDVSGDPRRMAAYSRRVARIMGVR